MAPFQAAGEVLLIRLSASVPVGDGHHITLESRCAGLHRHTA
jgi:hypothetical protein